MVFTPSFTSVSNGFYPHFYLCFHRCEYRDVAGADHRALHLRLLPDETQQRCAGHPAVLHHRHPAADPVLPGAQPLPVPGHCAAV